MHNKNYIRVCTGFLIVILTACGSGDSTTQTSAKISDKNSTSTDKTIDQAQAQAKYDSMWELAAAGDAKAQFEISQHYEHGKVVPKNYRTALQWLLKAAEQDHVEAQRLSGYHYQFGRGAPINSEQAFYWHERAAQLGDAVSQREIGRFYHDGTGVAKDYGKSIEWLKKSADQGNAQATYEYGREVLKGHGVKADEKKGLKLIRKAAEMGDIEANFFLGKDYQSLGYYVDVDPKRARQYFRRAAEMGHKTSQGRLGNLLRTGIGGSVNRVEAYVWLTRSGPGGALPLIHLRKRMSEREIKKAKKLLEKPLEQIK